MQHIFGETQHTNEYDDHPYRKCQVCGKVMFESDDDFFNLECSTRNQQRKELRNRLESNND